VVGVLLSTAVPDTSVTSFPFGSFAVAKAVLLYQHQYPLELCVCSFDNQLEAPTASVAIGFQ
jgi:hypothetical protein